MVGGGNPSAFCEVRPGGELATLARGGNPSFVTSGLLTTNPLQYSVASAVLGHLPPRPPPPGGLIQQSRIVDIPRLARRLHPAGLGREQGFSAGLVRVSEKPALVRCHRLRLTFQIRPPIEVEALAPGGRCIPRSVSMTAETSVMFAPGDVERAAAAGVNVERHVFSRSLAYYPEIGVHDPTNALYQATAVPLCSSTDRQAIVIGMFANRASCPTVVRLGQAVQQPALRMRIECVHTRLVQL